MSDTAADLRNLGDWIVYLEAQRKIHMAKIEDLEAALAKLSEAVMASTVEFKRQRDDERLKHEAQIDRAVTKVTELYDALVNRDDEQQPVSAEPAQDP